MTSRDPNLYGEIISCPLCGGKTYKVLFPSTLKKDDFTKTHIKTHLKNSLDDYTKHSRIVRCHHCSLVYTNPRENIRKLYAGYEDVVDQEYLKTESFRKILLSEHLQTVERFKNKGKILDVGCFAGYFLELAKEHGWQTHGIEPSLWASKEAKKRGVNIVGKTIESTRLPNDSYDVVTLWDVIEHLPNPHTVMHTLAKIVKKGGIVVMGTPNIDSTFARLTGSRCPFLIRMHLILYSPKTLRKLFEKYGFRVVYTKNYARTFPIWYILDKLQAQDTVFRSVNRMLTNIPFVANIPVKLYLGDSFEMVAERI